MQQCGNSLYKSKYSKHLVTPKIIITGEHEHYRILWNVHKTEENKLKDLKNKGSLYVFDLP